jgi:hypothetical protein
MHITSILTRLGFRVNRSKSFTGGQSFRESCGVFAFEGEVVTPVQFRLPFFRKGNWDAKVYAAFIGHINWCKEHGLHSYSAHLLRVLKDYGFDYRIPFVTDKNAFGIWVREKHPVPDSALRWNADWQVHEELVQGIGPLVKLGKAEKLELYRWNLWWRARVSGYTHPDYQSRSLLIRPQETRVAPVWTRCE